jgi:hypothetical protein
MPIAVWSTPGTPVSIAGTALNGVINTANSAVMPFDNSSGRILYARAIIKLGSITPAAGGSVTLRYVGNDGSDYEDIVGTLESYTLALATGTGAKMGIIEMVRIYPFSDGFALTNNSGGTLNASGNSITIIPFGEEIG